MKNRIFSGEAPESAGTQTGNNRGFLDYIRIFWTHFWQLAFLNIADMPCGQNMHRYVKIYEQLGLA